MADDEAGSDESPRRENKPRRFGLASSWRPTSSNGVSSGVDSCLKSGGGLTAGMRRGGTSSLRRGGVTDGMTTGDLAEIS